jgi:hypothetical protein
MAEHVRVHGELELGRDAEPGDQLAEAGSGERRAALRGENVRALRLLLAPKPAQRP